MTALPENISDRDRIVQVLQIVETLLKQNDLLVKCDSADLPNSAAAAVFLCSLLQACRGKLQLGRIIRVPLPATRAGSSISPQRRIRGAERGPGRPLQRSVTRKSLSGNTSFVKAYRHLQ